jgi:hypothetical protein
LTGLNLQPKFLAFLVLSVMHAFPQRAGSLDRLTIVEEGRTLALAGRILVEAQDGSLLLETPDGRYWAISAEQIGKRESDNQPFRYFTADELAEQLRRELGPNFSVRKTAHYLIVYNCGESYAAWCGWLFERLYTAHMNFWSRRTVTVREPQLPLTAVIFGSRSAFNRFAQEDVGEAASSIIGYYHLLKNYMILYDLTEVTAGASQTSRRSLAEINRLLAHPEAYRAVSTIVHEATHQLCFNTGMFSRLAETPLWLSEGIAMYFETPDLQSTTGWRSIGEINPKRLADFRAYRVRRQPGALNTLIEADDRFRDTSVAPDSYAEAWALTYFLLRRYPQKMASYVKLMGQLRPLEPYPAQKRREDFQRIFGESQALEAEFLRFMERL